MGRLSDEGLVVDWEFNENAGYQTFDTEGTNPLSLSWDPPARVAGIRGNALDFDSASAMGQFLWMADTPALSITSDLTISAWIKPETVTAATGFDIAGKWDTNGFNYLLTQYGDEIQMYLEGASQTLNSTPNVTTNAANLSAGTWYHVAGVYDASAQSVTIYINGQATASTVNGTIPASLSDGGSAFGIGATGTNRAPLDAPYSRTYNGIIDSVRVYARALNSSDVSQLYSSLTLDLLGNDASIQQSFTSAATAGYILGDAATFSAARDTSTSFSTAGNLSVGTQKPGNYQVYRSYLEFDTSGLPDTAVITDARLALATFFAGNTDSVDVYKYAWSSPIGAGNREANYDAAGAALDTIWGKMESTLDKYRVSPSLSASWVSLTATTQYQLRSKGDVSNTYLNKTQHFYNTSGTYPPKLWITYPTTPTSWGSGATPSADQKPMGRAFPFNGSTQYAQAQDSPVLDFGDTSDFSLSVWVKRSDATTDDTIVAKRNGVAAGDTGYLLRLNSTDEVFFEVSDGTDKYSLQSSVLIADTNWHHIVVTFDESSAAGCRLYIDSIEDAGVTKTGTLANEGSLANAVQFTVAAESDGGSPFAGTIDEIKLYDTVQTAAQVKMLYNRGKAIVIDEGARSDWLGGYNYRKPLVVSDPGTGDSGTQVLLTIDTAALVTATKLQADCDDLRFTNTSQTALTYWIEYGCNTATTKVWVDTGQGSGDFSIYMYYGNPAAAAGTATWAGNVILMSNTTCPAGWTRYTTLDAKYPQGSSTAEGTGGAASHTHTTNTTTTGSGGVDGTTYTEDLFAAINELHTHTVSLTGASANNQPPYRDVIYCYRSTMPVTVATTFIALYDTMPTGWTRTSAFDTYFPRGSATYGGAAGSATQSHLFTGYTGNYTASYTDSVGIEGSCVPFSPEIHSHYVSLTSSSDSVVPPYRDMFFALPNATATLPSGVIALFTTAPPMGWNRYAALDGVFPRGNSTAGTTGGAATHYHTITGNTQGSGEIWGCDVVPYSGYMSAYHTHSVSLTSDTQSHIPEYVTELFYKQMRDDSTYTEGTEEAGGAAAMWRFDEGVGTVAYDDTGNNRDGTLTNGPLWVEGAIPSPGQLPLGRALDFDGTDDYVTMAANAAINLQNKTGYSISAWINPDSDGETDTGNIWRKGSSYLRVDTESAGTVKVSVSIDLATTDATLTSTATIPINAWSHVVAIWQDDADDEVSLYINGVLDSTSTNGVGSATDDSASAQNIGGNAGATTFDGTIDEVRIFNYSLSADEIAVQMNRGRSAAYGVGVSDIDPRANLVSWWKLDDATGTTAVDPIGGNSLTLVNTPTWAVGKVGKGLSLTRASSQYGYIADNASLSLTGDVSIEAWIKPASVTAATKYTIAGKWDGANVSYLLEQNGDELIIYADTAMRYVYTKSTNLVAGTWYHVIATIDVSAAESAIYVNGIRQTVWINTGTPASIGDDAGRFQIGVTDSTTTAANFYDGVIDNVKLFNTALTPAQAAFEYDGGKPMFHWRLDEKSGTTAYDSGPHPVNGTLTNMDGATDWVAGKFNNGLDFDGTNDYLDFGDNDQFTFMFERDNTSWSSLPFSISIWGNFSDITDRVLLAKMGFVWDYDDREWAFETSGDNLLVWQVDYVGGIISAFTTAPITSVEGGWHQFTWTSDGSTAAGLTVYIDGIAQAVTRNGTTINHAKNTTATMGTYKFIDGAYAPIAPPGKMDEIKIYNYQLTPDQVLLDYNNSKAVRFN